MTGVILPSGADSRCNLWLLNLYERRADTQVCPYKNLPYLFWSFTRLSRSACEMFSSPPRSSSSPVQPKPTRI